MKKYPHMKVRQFLEDYLQVTPDGTYTFRPPHITPINVKRVFIQDGETYPDIIDGPHAEGIELSAKDIANPLNPSTNCLTWVSRTVIRYEWILGDLVIFTR